MKFSFLFLKNLRKLDCSRSKEVSKWSKEDVHSLLTEQGFVVEATMFEGLCEVILEWELFYNWRVSTPISNLFPRLILYSFLNSCEHNWKGNVLPRKAELKDI